MPLSVVYMSSTYKKKVFTFQMYTQARCIEHLLSSSGEVTWISRVYSKTCLFHIRPFANNNRCYADVALCNISSTSSFLCVVVVVSLCTCVRVNDFFCCLYIVITDIASEFEYFSLKWEQKNNEKRKQTGGGNSTFKKKSVGDYNRCFLTILKNFPHLASHLQSTSQIAIAVLTLFIFLPLFDEKFSFLSWDGGSLVVII